MFSYQYNFNVIFGSGAISRTGDKLKEMGCTRALICCDDGIVKFGLLDKLTCVLDTSGILYKVYDKVVPNPIEQNVREACEAAQCNGTDCFIAIGGGSSIDTAKAASILLKNGKLMQDNPMVWPAPGLPVIAIPTTSGTGSDMSIGAMISNDQTHAKMAVVTPTPVLSICDPDLTRSLPKGATIFGAVDAMMHAIEGYTSRNSSKYSDLICENCIRTVCRYLPDVLDHGDDAVARAELMFASSSCGSVIATSYLHAGHAIGHAIGGALNIVHGMAVIVTAPQLLYIMAKAIPERCRQLGQLLGADISGIQNEEELGLALKMRMTQLLKKWGIKNLKEQGCSLDELYACIPTILNDLSLYSAPKQITEDDVRCILNSAYTF